ncbi:MAG: M14 family metallopeptidase [Myxococcota bacterium]
MLNVLLSLALAAPLVTVAEQSGWTKTGRYEEVERLCAAFPKAWPGRVKCERFGTTPLGRPMLMLVASADGVFSPEQAKKKQRPVVLIQGGIHAGEIDGKDAGLRLLREVLDGRVAKGALEKLTLVFVPVFNVDGHERFGPNQRPNQRGPEEMGWRVSAQNLNLNRDYMKADAPEMVAMLGLLHRYEPVLYVDLHVTDGAKFQHDVSVCFEPRRIGSDGLRTWGRTLRQSLFQKLEARGHLPVDFYPAFEDADDPQSGFDSGWPPPRFGNAYWALHHRLGVLVETHSWRPYAHRVQTTFDVCAALLEDAAAHAADWDRAAKQADDAAAKLAGQPVVLLWEATKHAEPFEFQGYEYVRAKSEVSGKFWVRYDETKPQVWKVPLRDELAPALTVTAPKAGYLVPASHAALLAPRLQAHGVRFEVLARAWPEAPVERMHVLEPKFRPGPYEGRLTLQVKGEWKPGVESLPAGSLFVPIAQPHAELVLHLFEPSAPDSFAAWGFFNAHLEQKEYLEDYLTEEYARQLLADPAIKAEFDAKLKDPAFAKDPDARLAFFSRRHPSFDARQGLLPVFRVDVSPAAR